MHVGHFDPAENFRFRYWGMFLGLGGLTVAFDFSLVVFLCFYNFSTPAYLYGTAIAVSLIEALYISVSVALIEFHVGTHSHWDMGKVLSPLWCGSVTINIAIFVGGSDELGTSTYTIGLFLVVCSQLSGLTLMILAVMKHILLLTDPNPQEHGWQPAKKKKRRHHHHRDEDDDDNEDLGSNDDDDDDDGGDDASVMQAESNDLLPSYMKGPAIIGAVASACAGISCVVGFFLLRKGHDYHRRKSLKAQSQGTQHHPTDGRQNHPIQTVDVAIFGLTMAAFLTEGAYFYMIACVLIADSDDYCVTIIPATSLSECGKGSGWPWVIVGILLLVCLVFAAWLFHGVTHRALKDFEEGRNAHYAAWGLDPNGGPGQAGQGQASGPYGGGQRDYDDRFDDDGAPYNDFDDGQGYPPSYSSSRGGRKW
ncbi:hypothetical protein JCM8547_001878 [Rhodosporidiobolus lusitaniae]